MEIKLIIISNFLNPHQYPLSQELYKLTDEGFRFIELEKIPVALEVIMQLRNEFTSESLINLKKY